MSPFWNHILGFLYVAIAKIAVTWKLAKKSIWVGIWTRDQNCARKLSAIHLPTLPTSSVSRHFFLFFFYIPNKDRIHMNSYAWKLRSTGIWIHTLLCMNSYLAARCVRCRHLFGGNSHINSAYHYCPDLLGCFWLPRPVRVLLAATTS